jgi:surfactin synthase thioesterase subunit
VCLPHAGGGASAYFSWGALLQPAGIEVRSVQYPARESRFADPAITDAGAMVRTIAERWEEIAGAGACALYGHSMGALLAFELAAELERRGAPNPPRHVFLTGHQAARLPYRAPRVHTLPEAEFLPAVNRHFGGIPEELLQDRDIAAMIASTLRNDFMLVENYAWQNTGPLAAPITAMGGDADPWTTEAELAAWAAHTRGAFALRMLAGDHFFNVTARDDVLAQIKADLRAE